MELSFKELSVPNSLPIEYNIVDTNIFLVIEDNVAK